MESRRVFSWLKWDRIFPTKFSGKKVLETEIFQRNHHGNLLKYMPKQNDISYAPKKRNHVERKGKHLSTIIFRGKFLVFWGRVSATPKFEVLELPLPWNLIATIYPWKIDGWKMFKVSFLEGNILALCLRGYVQLCRYLGLCSGNVDTMDSNNFTKSVSKMLYPKNEVGSH